jgi:hypothetical protein
MVCGAAKPGDCFRVHCAQPAISGSRLKVVTYVWRSS